MFVIFALKGQAVNLSDLGILIDTTSEIDVHRWRT
jgi:hypothetical protein